MSVAGQRRICIAIGLAGGSYRYRSILLVDGEVGRGIGDIVVAQDTRRAEGRADRVWTACNGLACGAAVSCRHIIRRQEAGQGAGQGRICIAIGLAGSSHGNRGILLVDGEVCRVVSDVVVGKDTGRAERRADRVWTACNGLACDATVGCRHVIRWQEAGQRAGQSRICIAIGLAEGIRCDRSSELIDGDRLVAVAAVEACIPGIGGRDQM